ncbi:hypothetical protein D7Y04_11285 [Corallococcus sp. AB038B]|nr:hypothetical protein D7Y04_11285 [Corallococcus sp. AB038B]
MPAPTRRTGPATSGVSSHSPPPRQTSDGSPLVGERDAFLTKYRYTGVRQWTRQVGGPGVLTEGYGSAVDGMGNSFLAGTANGGVDGNTRIGTFDAFVTKFDATGVKQWTRQLGTLSATTHGRKAAADAAAMSIWRATAAAVWAGTRTARPAWMPTWPSTTARAHCCGPGKSAPTAGSGAPASA